MMKRWILLLLVIGVKAAQAQKADADLLRIKQRMDSVKQFSAVVTLNVDVPFIKMPTKTAKVNYNKGKGMAFSSTDFVMLPKRGFDVSLDEIFKHPFITVDRGTEKQDGVLLRVINVIPTDNRSDMVLATLYMDTKAVRLVRSEINTRKDGSYTLLMQYANQQAVLPKYIEASFAIERLKIPFNFMGKDTKIDRKRMRAIDTKTGKIMMKLDNYSIKMG